MLREGRVVEIASLKQLFMALSQKVHQTHKYSEPNPQELHYMEFLVCPYIFIGTPAFICHFWIWYHGQHGLMQETCECSFPSEKSTDTVSHKYGTSLNTKHTTEKMRSILAHYNVADII